MNIWVNSQVRLSMSRIMQICTKLVQNKESRTSWRVVYLGPIFRTLVQLPCAPQLYT